MYDTMKDRRIGIPEVIEKFGVPPEKVVEVQALAGDSTDNVPGVPGIGIKTAAQLIVEYGDLEQLLFRAGEIKQPKRREALIENAEKARISRQLVLLDDKVDLEVPLDEAVALMERHQIRRVPVVDKKGRCVGIISQADIAWTGNPSEVGEMVREVSRDTAQPSR
jgi:5'-3' exonuclease